MQNLQTKTLNVQGRLLDELDSFKTRFGVQSETLTESMKRINYEMDIHEICQVKKASSENEKEEGEEGAEEEEADPKKAPKPLPFQNFQQFLRYLYKAPFEQMDTNDFYSKQRDTELHNFAKKHVDQLNARLTEA